MGYVYLLSETDRHNDKTYKIGISKNHPTLRVKQLATGNPYTIDLVNFYETKNFKDVERMLHARYQLYKTPAKNEWFYLTDIDVSNFTNICNKSDETINFLKQHNHFYCER